MPYRLARQLHRGDEVTVKGSGIVVWVVDTEVQEKNVFVCGNNGVLYHHTAIS